MDDVVAVELGLGDGEPRYFLTWGRIQNAVDPAPVCDPLWKPVDEVLRDCL